MRDGDWLIVIGASAGGVRALLRLVAELPGSTQAAVAIALHLPARSSSNLPALLAREGHLPATFAQDGEPILPSRIYVAPPDRHLAVADGAFRLVRGPKENHHRPGIDALFRSAAQARGPHVIGVVLSGRQDDGALGLAAIRRAGGIAVVQDPADAEFPSMPLAAVEVAGFDHLVPLSRMGALLAALPQGRTDRDAEREIAVPAGG